MSNIFEIASRKKFRFNSVKGDLSVEQLWDLPLQIATPTREAKADLASVARTINAELKALGEDDFVNTTPNPLLDVLTAKLEVVKHIIDVKKAEIAASEKKALAQKERRKLVEALASKETEEIKNLSKEDILKRLEALDG